MSIAAVDLSISPAIITRAVDDFGLNAWCSVACPFPSNTSRRGMFGVWEQTPPVTICDASEQVHSRPSARTAKLPWSASTRCLAAA